MSVYLDLLQGRNPENSIATEGLKEVGAGIKKAFSNFIGKIIGWIDKVCQWFKNHKPRSKNNLKEKNTKLSQENSDLKDKLNHEKEFSDHLKDENNELRAKVGAVRSENKSLKGELHRRENDLKNERVTHMTDNTNTAQGSRYVKQIMDILSLTIKASSAYNTQINTFVQTTTEGSPFEHVESPSNMKTFKNNHEIIENCLDQINQKYDFSNDNFSFTPQMTQLLIPGLITQLQNEKKILEKLKSRYDNEVSSLFGNNSKFFIDREIERIFKMSTGCIQTILAHLTKTINWTKRAVE